MAIVTIPLIILIYWVIDKIEGKQASKQYREYQEDLKKRGLKYYE